MRSLVASVLVPTLALGLPILGFAACSTDETTAEPGPSFTVVSYNGGLARGFVEATDARAPLTIEALAAVVADVICVQEFWLPEHVDALKAATQAGYPNSVFLSPDNGTTTTAACAPADTLDLRTCVTANGCDLVCADKLISCSLMTCSTEAFALPPECLACVQANIGNPLDDIIAICEAESGEYAYGGSFGIGLLSKSAIKAQDTLVMDSTTNRRGVAYALVDTPLGEVHAFCTHLTAVFSDIVYPKTTGSWEEEQAAQIDEMILWAESKAGGGQIVIMGDMNTGPAGDGYIAEVPQNYQKFVDAGYANPYAETAGAPCTYCGDNPIVSRGNDDNESVVIDHILTNGFSVSGSGTRIIDGGVTVDNCDETINSAYSDHYGLAVTLQ
jgi:endonuclease/exonuclease/phosphatase family metal-dependent hydrolase